ncbi:MAG: hypothetical protein M3Y03_01015 [Verrucomicrobiota bacterium]|nr:hypothetical protein [Verrucomicrobiota bacterium]
MIAFVVIMTVASLFVTIIVQMLSAALSLRGKNLANALALTFQSIEPTLGEQAHQLAAKILSDPLLSDSTRTTKDKSHARTWVLKRNGPWNFIDFGGASHLANAIRPDEVYAFLRRLQERAGTVPAEKGKADEMQETAAKILRVLATSSERGPTAVELDPARAKFDAWFKSAQDRAQQWFQMHARGLTIAASILVALVLQLDAVEIFHFVSTNGAARNALVGNAEQLIKNESVALDQKGGLIEHIADAWIAQTQSTPLNLAGVTNTRQLRDLFAAQPNFNARSFDEVVATSSRAYFDEQHNQLADLTKAVSATGFEFIPVGYWRWPAGAEVKGSIGNIAPHLPGIALFAALLTLGAPYWFNILKNLASLRPALARAISNDETAAPAPER